MNTEVTEYDEREMNRDVKLSDFRNMDREIYSEDIYDAYNGDLNEYKKSVEREKAKEEAEKKRAYEQAQRKQKRQDFFISSFVAFIPVFFVLMCFFTDASSGYYLLIKFIFAINGGYCLLKIVDDFRQLDPISKISYIGLTIIGLIAIASITGARYDKDLWLVIDFFYCVLKVLSFISEYLSHV